LQQRFQTESEALKVLQKPNVLSPQVMNLFLQGQMAVLAAAMRILRVGLFELDFAQPAFQSSDEHLVALV
jgi:hypothetical protein